MIKNERQYRITKAQAARFSDALEKLRQLPDPELHPVIAQAQEDALRSQLRDLENELREYESLKSGDFPMESLKAVSEVPSVLIKARIATGLSQRDLAERVGLKEQQIQRYEATDYAAANLARIMEVASALGTAVEGPASEAGTRSSDLSDLSFQGR